MKTVVWYLPSGAGGMAALHKSNKIRVALAEWAKHRNIDLNIKDNLTFLSQNGFRYYQLTLPEDTAIMFALTWNNSDSSIRYEYLE